MNSKNLCFTTRPCRVELYWWGAEHLFCTGCSDTHCPAQVICTGHTHRRPHLCPSCKLQEKWGKSSPVTNKGFILKFGITVIDNQVFNYQELGIFCYICTYTCTEDLWGGRFIKWPGFMLDRNKRHLDNTTFISCTCPVNIFSFWSTLCLLICCTTTDLVLE